MCTYVTGKPVHTYLLHGPLHRVQFSHQGPVQQQDQWAETSSPSRTFTLAAGAPQDGVVVLRGRSQHQLASNKQKSNGVRIAG